MERNVWMDTRTMMEYCLEGRSRKTFLTYVCVPRMLWIHSLEIRKLVIWLTASNFVGNFIQFDRDEAKVNMFK